MSEEQRNDDEAEVEGHVIEVRDESDEDDEVEAHVMRFPNVRME